MHGDFSHRPLWQRLLLNRFAMTLGLIAAVTVVWNIYVATHAHGLVAGRVVDASGRPVAGATVTLWVYNFVTYEQKQHVDTDADGNFRFTDNPSHRIEISAQKAGIGHAERVPVNLYFRSQDTVVAAPLKLLKES